MILRKVVSRVWETTASTSEILRKLQIIRSSSPVVMLRSMQRETVLTQMAISSLKEEGSESMVRPKAVTALSTMAITTASARSLAVH